MQTVWLGSSKILNSSEIIFNILDTPIFNYDKR